MTGIDFHIHYSLGSEKIHFRSTVKCGEVEGRRIRAAPPAQDQRWIGGAIGPEIIDLVPSSQVEKDHVCLD